MENNETDLTDLIVKQINELKYTTGTPHDNTNEINLMEEIKIIRHEIHIIKRDIDFLLNSHHELIKQFKKLNLAFNSLILTIDGLVKRAFYPGKYSYEDKASSDTEE